MARPSGSTEPIRNGFGHDYNGGPAVAAHAGSFRGYPGAPDPYELQSLHAENAQLRQLCGELEQALHEASQHGGDWEARQREYETLLEEKTNAIRELHEQLEQAQTIAAELEAQLTQASPCGGGADAPLPREDELLALSEELERERRQLQEDEQSLMAQMREMEVGMARERAEIARQRNDLQRLQGEIRHEIDRLERNGAIQSKIESLKNKLQDATARRGVAPAPTSASQSGVAPQPGPSQPTPLPQQKGGSSGLIGRLFGGR